VQPLPYYTRLAEEQLTRARSLQQRYDRLAVVRLLVVLGLIPVFILAFDTGFWVGAVLLLVVVPLLGLGIRHHLSIGKAAARSQVQGQLAEAELLGLQHDFTHWDDGDRYADPGHPYAIDLDIFGRHSLYQFINRTVTAIGSDLLADHLATPAPHDVARQRREDSKLLSDDPDWNMWFRTLGSELADDPAYARRLLEWVDRPPVVTGNFARLMLWLAPLLAIAGVWYCLTQPIWQLGLLFFVPTIVLLRRYSDAAATEHAYTSQVGKILTSYRELLGQIESRYGQLPGGATDAIGKLAFYTRQLDVRNNAFVFLLEISGLWSLQWLSRLDRWRNQHRQELESWLSTLATVDARVSWATLRFNRPEWTEPELTDERVLRARGLGHPLLPPASRITNDIDLSTDGHIHLVTGSNMAGKSTWLRTVGINIVLARAGGPVCALHLRTAALQVWTSMRTQDDLSESTSSFYAELKRLKAIIEAVARPEQQVFFLLDEILKGTNSRDRHTGSRALIRQLIRERGAGIIATHDLELAALEHEPGSRVENYAMEVQTKGGELVFDYKLHRGVSRSFNATALMARMGIEIDPEDIKLTHD